MDYCTTTTLQTRMIGTTFDTATTALAGEAIGDAQSDINAYITKRYDVSGWTYTTTPPLIQNLTARLAMGYMYRDMSRGSKDALKRADHLIDGVFSILESIVNFKTNLQDTSGALIDEISDSSSYFIKSTTEDYQPVFDYDSIEKWAYDQDQLDDIDDSRD